MQEITPQLTSALADRYRIERHLGEGGMATVYLARDLRHDRRVAVKVLKPDLAAAVGAERFLAEIKTTANLQHPHILPLHDSGEAGGFLFYVMPYVEGESLRDRLDREHQLGVQDALTITQKVAGALDYAHSQGVIHRDIKPGNILLSAQGEPLVADFGIALAVAHAGGTRMTETGLSLGTPHYMSPEQATGDQHVGRATDTYALACVLYEMLVGEPPYTGSTPQAVLGKIVAGKLASAAEQRPAVPAHVDAAIKKALEKLPADRFASAQDFAQALADAGFRYGEQVGATALAGAHGPWNRLTIAMTGLAAALAIALGLALRMALAGTETTTPATRFLVAAPEGAAFARDLYMPQMALSPDGEWLAFVATDGVLYRRGLGQLEAEPVPGAEGAGMPFFSPDGAWLGFHSQGRLRKVSMAGGPPAQIAEAGNVAGASWGDDGVIVFARNFDGALFTVPQDGGAPTPVLGPSEGVPYSHPWVLPGGEAALMTVRADDPADVRVVVVDLETGVADTLGFGTRAAYASGHLLVTGADGTLLAQPFDARARRTTGPAVAILAGVALDGLGGMGQFSLSSEGGLAYQTGAGPEQTLVIVGPAGAVDVQLPGAGDLADPAYSPDGRRIAMRSSSQIWIWDRDQETLERLTAEGLVNMAPVWTPDGARVTFMSHREGAPQGQIFWQPADGSGPAEPLLPSDYYARPYSWSPDGETLAFTGQPNGSMDIGLLTLGDSTPRWLLETEFNESSPHLSPDGRWLAYTSDRSGEAQVYVQPTSGEGSRVQVSTEGGTNARWDPDGGTLYYARDNGGQSTISAAEVSTEGGFRVTSRSERFAVDDVGQINYDISPDGEEFVHIRNGASTGRDLVWILNWPEILREMASPR